MASLCHRSHRYIFWEFCPARQQNPAAPVSISRKCSVQTPISFHSLYRVRALRFFQSRRRPSCVADVPNHERCWPLRVLGPDRILWAALMRRCFFPASQSNVAIYFRNESAFHSFVVLFYRKTRLSGRYRHRTGSTCQRSWPFEPPGERRSSEASIIGSRARRSRQIAWVLSIGPAPSGSIDRKR